MTAMEAFGLFLLVLLGSALVFRVPMAFSMGLTCIALILFANQPAMALAQTSFSSLDSFPFLAIPFFVFAGALMEYSGISGTLVDFVQSVVGRVRGSLGALMVLASMAFGVLTGSTNATLSSIGKMLVPELERHGYKRTYAAALAAASGFLGILIPPSVPGIFYALSAGQDISSVWISTVIPAFLIGTGYIFVNYLKHGRFETKQEGRIDFKKYLANVGISAKNAFAALLMPIIIFGGIYGGIFTPTEAGAVCCVYGIIFYIIKRIRKGKMEKSLLMITVESGSLTAVIAMICAFSNSAGRMLTRIGVASALSSFITSHVSSPLGFLLICNIIFVFLGMLIDINSSILIMTPLLLPTALAYGINPIHFGAVMLVNLCVGYLTPPMASSLYLMCRLSDVSFVDIVKEVWPFIIVGFVTVALVTLFPVLSTGLVALIH